MLVHAFRDREQIRRRDSLRHTDGSPATEVEKELPFFALDLAAEHLVRHSVASDRGHEIHETEWVPLLLINQELCGGVKLFR